MYKGYGEKTPNVITYEMDLLLDFATGGGRVLDAKTIISKIKNHAESLKEKDAPWAEAELKTAEKTLRLIEKGDITLGDKGSLYKVELAPKENEYLLWDKPVPERFVDKIVKKSVEEGLVSDRKTAIEGIKSQDADRQGSIFYRELSDQVGGDGAASQFLKEAGIPGIKYLDGSSRAKGKGDYNYVLFDEGDVAITEKMFMPSAKDMQQAVKQGQHGDIPNAATELSPQLANKLFLPAAYSDPGFSPKTYIGKIAFPMMADRMKTGIHITRSGKEFELRGGPDHPDMQINQGKVGWASMPEQKTDLQQAINRTDGIGLVVLMNEDAVASNRTFARILLEELAYDLENTPFAKRRIPKQIKDAATSVRKWARKKKKKKYYEFKPRLWRMWRSGYRDVL